MQSTSLIDWTERGIFCDQRTDTWDIYTLPMDPDAQRPTGPPLQIPYPRAGRNVSPVWSPDGRTLAFVSSAATEQDRRYVVVMPAGGGQAREFLIPTTSWQYSQSPYDLRWFGDGRGLGFSGHDSRQTPAVFRLTLDTGNWDTILLSADQYRTTIEWNRDGSAFYFARGNRANPGIFERGIHSDTERAVYRSAAPLMNLTRLEFSPDRKWLAFQEWPVPSENNTIVKHIAVVDVATGEQRIVLETVRLTAEASAPDLVGWTPAGDLLIHSRGTGADPESVMMPVNGGPSRSIAIPTFGPRAPGATPSGLVAKWSSDGRTMALGRVSRGGETYVIEHPLAAVRATTASR
jgi:Tol biopolymer transport system component